MADKRGAKGKLNAKVAETIVDALANGLTRETAAKYGRISYQSFYHWYMRGKKEFLRIESGESATREHIKAEKIYLNFFNQVEEAEAEAIVGWQLTINRHAKNDPIWANKMLTLRDPKGYKPSEVAFTYDLTKANREQLERIAAGEDPATVMADTGPGPSTPDGDGQPDPG